MKKTKALRILSTLLTVVMLASIIPVNVFAAIDFDATGTETGTDDYYKLISRRDWELAPGISESEIILNNAEGTLRQVTHVVEVDLNNQYTKVVPGYKGMIPTPGNYGTQSVSAQAAYAEENGYGNVVAATNCSLSWYNSAYYTQKHPELVGEPLGYMVLDGQKFVNSQGQSAGAKCCIVINYNEIDGETRPADTPRVTIRSTEDTITGWEEQVIPVNFGFLVKDTNGDGIGENQYASSKNHTSGFESRTFVGVKADGTLVVAVVDGRQAPYSSGFNNYEMADYMIKLGCVVAANCDGGGSTEFMSQRPGEDLTINCSLSDGGERPTTNSILIISNAPANGEFARATIETDYDYYTPGSTVKFNAVGSDLVGTKVDVPSDVEWQIEEEGMGTISNGVFVSNGTEGTVTAKMVYNGEVVGKRTIDIVIPTEISFTQPVVTIPYGKTARIPVKATIENGLKEVAVDGNAVSFTTTNSALGTFDGINFTAVSEANAPADTTSVVTASLTLNPSLTASVEFNLGKESVVLEDFENGLGDWVAIVQRNTGEAHRDFVHDISIVSKEDGMVHDGNYSLRLQTNGLASKAVHSQQYAYVRLGLPYEQIVLENARGLGFWLYVPEDNIQCWVQGYYRYDTDGNGTYDTMAEVNLMNSENVYYNVDKSGWHYMHMDLSDHEKVLLGGEWNPDPDDLSQKGDFFIAIIFHKSINNQLWQNSGTINGPFTYYIDNITVDYSEAVDDREAPVFGKIYLDNAEMKKRSVVNTSSNILNVTANVAEATERVEATGETSPLYNYTGIDAHSAKAYVDGVEVPCTYADGKISMSNVAVADGYHRVTLEISDNAGNKTAKERVVNVESGIDASTVRLVPKNADLDRLLGGSVYWMNLEATDIETIKSVTAEIDMNSVNRFELDHMELADGFSAEYTINEETNTATITITRTGKNTETGEKVLAEIPVRIISFDDMQIPGYTAQTFWTSYNLWPHDLKLDVDKGVITFVDDYETEILNTFSNEEFHVDTEIYTDAQSMSVSYRNEKGTAHVHTPESISDLAPTCSKAGYTARTYCNVCDSVVDWGTSVEPKGHSYKVVENTLVCDCGETYTDNGLVETNGKTYYVAAGTLTSGWLTIDEVWYYFDKTTYEGMNGEFTYNDVTYEFENGRLKKGVWVFDGVGTKYYYGPSYYICKNGSPYANVMWADIEGERYGFDKKGYRHEGLKVLVESSQAAVLYQFTDEGVLLGEYKPDHTGFFQCNGMLAYLKDGVPFAAGLVKENDDYYYFNSGCIAVTSRYNVTRTNGLLPAGYYTFGADGKMTDIPAPKNGPHTDGFFYINNVKQLAYQLIEFEGNYYFINDGNKVAKNKRVYLSTKFVDGTPIEPGYYNFDEDGKLVILNGPQDDGYFYVNGIRQTAYQLVEYEGDYYFIDDAHKLAKNKRVYLSTKFVEGTDLATGYYNFDAEGKMVILNGPQADGYFYIDGIRQSAYQLVEYEGDYYFIDDAHKIAKNKRVYLSEKFTEGTDLATGYYEFDDEGKLIILNGPQADGCFYLNGVKQRAYQLIEFEGSYYFINDGNKIAKDKRIYLSAKFTEGTDLATGYYNFDSEGKIVILNGPQSDGYFYLNGIRQSAYQLVEYEDNYYFIDDAHKLAKNKRIYLSAKFTEGTDLATGYYNFDEEGRLVILNGPQSDGYFYLNGIRQSAYQLVEFEGSYYFIDDAHKLAKNKRIYLSAKFTEGTDIPTGYYNFDENGKLVILNGPQADGYFYLNGIKQLAYQLIMYKDNYYFINDGNKYTVDKKMHIGDNFLQGTYLYAGYYEFDTEGKMIGHVHGIRNGRDLGDIPFMVTTDGKDIKSGLLIRGGELDNVKLDLSDEQRQEAISALKNIYGVKSDIDLRSPNVGGQDVLGNSVPHKYFNMVMYKEAFTDDGKAKMKEVFTELANPANYPMYFHCSYGIDRTGTVCYILEAVLGVSEQYALREYLLSLGSYGNRILEVRDGLKAYGGATLKECAEAYLLDCGITSDQIESLRNIFIED